jgi:3',5'-cyclic-AMP phosphodiesterase
MTLLRLTRQRQEYSRERKQWLKQVFQVGSTYQGRRRFLQMAAMAAGAAATKRFWPHSFQLVEVANAAPQPSGSAKPFTFAYISDSHLYERALNERFVRQIERAVADVNALNPQPDFVLYGGDLAQLGEPSQLKLGAEILNELRSPVRMMVGEHDWFLDLGEKWKDMFGAPYYSFDHKGVHFVTLMSVHEKDFWTAKGYTPMQRMQIVAGLDDSRQSRFEVGEEERAWLAQDLAKVSTNTPLIVFSHSPLYKLYRDWNFWTDDAEQVQALLRPFASVTVIHGHTHQVLTNRIGNIFFHGMLGTAWPWPYAPEGLPKLTVQMNRPDPFDQVDGLGTGTIDVKASGRVDKHYNFWNRDPMVVSARYLESNGAEDRPPKTTLASY